MNPNNNLDRILDQALSQYSDAEPLAGMEERILRRIAAQPEPTSRRWAWILATAATAAVLVVALWLGSRERPRQRPTASDVAQQTQQGTTSVARAGKPVAPSAQSHPEVPILATARRRASSVGPEIAQSAVAKPVLKQFPAAAPMTTEEHALLALARKHPEALFAQPEDKDKLSIAPIEIKPLASETGAPQGEQP